MKDLPIGIFDSGIGGLTVLHEISRLLPNERTIYLGDTARVPYGSKSQPTIEHYSHEVADFLTEKGIKMLVVACNTASAYGLPSLVERLNIPVIGVIDPGARAAVRKSGNNRIGVIGTEGTISSRAYTEAIKRFDSTIRVFSKACPLFVPLAEEGWTDNDISHLVALEYLGEFTDDDIDTIVLGCTHYPLLKSTISKVIGGEVNLIDSAEATAEAVREVLSEEGLLKEGGEDGGTHTFYVTDSPERFIERGKRFLGERLTEPLLVTLGEKSLSE